MKTREILYEKRAFRNPVVEIAHYRAGPSSRDHRSTRVDLGKQQSPLQGKTLLFLQ